MSKSFRLRREGAHHQRPSLPHSPLWPAKAMCGFTADRLLPFLTEHPPPRRNNDPGYVPVNCPPAVTHFMSLGNVNSVEWNDGMERWSRLLECHAHKFIHVHCSMASYLEKQLKNRSKVVWGAMPNPGTQTRSKVKNISSKVT